MHHFCLYPCPRLSFLFCVQPRCAFIAASTPKRDSFRAAFHVSSSAATSTHACALLHTCRDTRFCCKYTQMSRDGKEDTLQPLRQRPGTCSYEQTLEMQPSRKSARRLRTGGTRHLLMKECISEGKARSERVVLTTALKAAIWPGITDSPPPSLSLSKAIFSTDYLMGHERTSQSVILLPNRSTTLWSTLLLLWSAEGMKSRNSVTSARR